MLILVNPAPRLFRAGDPPLGVALQHILPLIPGKLYHMRPISVKVFIQPSPKTQIPYLVLST